MESCPTQAVLPLVGLAAEKVIRDRYSRKRCQQRDCNPLGIGRGVRQLLANKASGNLAGIWRLIAEHFRLGTRGSLRGWTRNPPECMEPRLAWD
ncbi:MAG: hypothetical protein ACQESR_15190 [Planctomycetota bacterium]